MFPNIVNSLFALLALAVILPLSGCKKPASAPANASNTSPATPEGKTSGTTEGNAAPVPAGPRFAIQKGCGGFADKEAVIEMIEARKHAANPTEGEEALVKIRLRQEGEGRRIKFDRDYIVRILTKDDETKFCEVEALNSSGLKKNRFWVHKSVLEGINSLSGSKIITGYTIFRGRVGTEIDNRVIHNLLDLIAGIYKGEISEEAALKCVFMPKAQQNQEDVCDVENIKDNYVIYRAVYYRALNRPVLRFAMPCNGNTSPLQSGPVRFIGREQFTTKSGVVVSIPVFDIQKDIQ